MTSEDHSEFETRRAAFEAQWAITWERELANKPDPDELRAHPQYKPTLEAWLASDVNTPV